MAYKHGGNVHKEVKEKSMHHLHGHAAHRKTGGSVEGPHPDENLDDAGDFKNEEPDAQTIYSGKSHVTEEAHGEEHKRGGKVAKKKRKVGGKVEEHKKKHLGKVEGEEKKQRLDRPARKRGGGVGADTSPLSHAHNFSERRGPTKASDSEGITGEA